METWASWFRSNFDKVLLTLIFAFLVFVVIHMTHDALDKEQIAWAREGAGTVLGGLLGLITGVRLAQASIHPSQPPAAPGGGPVPPDGGTMTTTIESK